MGKINAGKDKKIWKLLEFYSIIETYSENEKRKGGTYEYSVTDLWNFNSVDTVVFL